MKEMKKIFVNAEIDASMMDAGTVQNTADSIIGELFALNCKSITIKDEEDNILAEKHATISENLEFAVKDFQKKLVLYSANHDSESDMGSAMALESVIDRLQSIIKEDFQSE